MTDRMRFGEDGPAVIEVDRLLREYYRAEMPNPWPRLVLPSRMPGRRLAVRSSSVLHRFALAASVVLAFVGYWALGGLFPTGPSGADLNPITGQIMQNPLRDRKIKDHSRQLSPVENIVTPNGNNAQMFEEELPDGQAILIIGTPTHKGPR